MPEFDRTLKFQFALFWAQPGFDMTSASMDTLHEALGNAPGGHAMGLRLSREPQAHQPSVEVVGNQTRLGIPMAFWQAAGIWQVQVSPMRLDVFFDANAYAAARDLESPPGAADALARIAPAFRQVTEKWSVSRTALVVTGEASDRVVPRPANVVARTFFNEEFQAQAAREEIEEATGRVNRRTHWRLSAENDAVVNRIETCAAIWALNGTEEQRWLFWQMDVNTTPTSTAPMSAEEIQAFFSNAEAWSSDSLARLEFSHE